MIDILREARAALLNPNLTEGERAVVVRVIEGGIDMLVIREHAALAGRGPDAKPSPDVRGLLEAVDRHMVARPLSAEWVLSGEALAAKRKEWP